MKLKRIRQILTIFLILFLFIGTATVFYTKKMTHKIENRDIKAVTTEEIESQQEETSILIKNDLSSYFGHSRKEIEETLGEPLVQITLDGQAIATNGKAQDFFLFLDGGITKAILLRKENDNFQVDGMKVGDFLSEKQAYLKEEYDYKNYILEGDKFDLYKKKNGNFVMGLSYEQKKIASILAYEKEYEDSLFKTVFHLENEGGNSEFTGYILEDSDKKYMEMEQLEALSERELILAEKEIYARYGAVFEEENIQLVFNRTEWYVPKELTEEDVEKKLNSYEKENIKRIEKALEEKADS